ncbi:MAG: type I-D CRISPR-associated endonuclease Cas1d [Anaerolineae bacterium]|nr:type I-D CRISPR-associated endonuclease Cas1 [Anaerolineae bacterium]
MTTLYLIEPHSTVRLDGDTLIVSIPEDKARQVEKRQVRVPLMKVDQVIVQGDATLTTPAVLALLEQHADICYCTYYGQFRGHLTPELSKNGILRIQQHQARQRYRQRITLASRFVTGKLANQRTLLLRSNRKLENDDVAQAAATIQVLLQQAEEITALTDTEPDPSQPQTGTPLGRLFGLEGAAGAAYFGVFGHLLHSGLGTDWQGRLKRPPPDPINALLSYGYVLLASKVASAISIVGLDPYVGYLHSTQYGKQALALDLMEEFRPVIVDSVVLTLVNNRILQPEHFESELGSARLTDAGRRRFLEQFETRLNTEIAHPVFKYKATYYRCLELQTRLLAKTVSGELTDYVPFVVR